MLVLISNSTAVVGETDIINVLFEEGLEILHMRKPGATVDEISSLIEKIDSKYHHQIALHQHHEIATGYGIKRLHFTEAGRKQMSEEALIRLKMANHILSTSIHQEEAYKDLPASFMYTFFGPVFNSISKQEYTSSMPADFLFPVKKNLSKVIAIGGIDVTNIQQVKQMQFNGAAILGAIWQKPGESIQQFKAIQKAWKQTDR
ncbi:thiamine phosphate synthase [Ferruginibacter sp.]|uniref:thiamine phosphate synthase n=1 Tax=Ferruginibacter sp. TaxID=1940288 RepID=UPI0026592383|nr:thiamine phosphate synthase [Ferruginibacter sp.]